MIVYLWIIFRVVFVLALFALGFMYMFGAIPTPYRYALIQKLPGPKGLPYFGHVFNVMRAEDIVDFLNSYVKDYSRIMALWILGIPTVTLLDPDDVQVVLSGMEYITKGVEYLNLQPWLNEGLLISTGEKWHRRRKQLTPAFHFKILEDNMSTFNKEAKKLTNNFADGVGKEINLEDVITVCTLNIIIGSAMGIEIGSEDEEKEYVQNLKRLSELIVKRIMSPHLYSDVVFYFSPTGRAARKLVKRLHSFSNAVIQSKKNKMLKEASENVSSSSGKTRMAFLDLMLELEMKDPGSFPDDGIREEVDTFMFEGHDTTTSALMFTLLNLANYQDVQEKVYQEISDILGDSDREITSNDLQRMVYLEKVVKETQRLYPSVPIMTRCLEQDMVLKDGTVIPSMSDIIIPSMILHKKEKYWPDPEKFDPERFSPENVQGRHPYSYIPFSAGPRNCIGQKFAMMEIKTVIATVVKNLKIHPVTKPNDLSLACALILRSRLPVLCKFSKRL